MHRVKILRIFFFLSSTGQYLDFCTGTGFYVQRRLQPVRLLYIYTFFSILSTHIAWLSLKEGQLHQSGFGGMYNSGEQIHGVSSGANTTHSRSTPYIMSVLAPCSPFSTMAYMDARMDSTRTRTFTT